MSLKLFLIWKTLAGCRKCIPTYGLCPKCAITHRAIGADVAGTEEPFSSSTCLWDDCTGEQCQHVLGSAHPHPFGILMKSAVKPFCCLRKRLYLVIQEITFFYDMNTQQILLNCHAEETVLFRSKS